MSNFCSNYACNCKEKTALEILKGLLEKIRRRIPEESLKNVCENRMQRYWWIFFLRNLIINSLYCRVHHSCPMLRGIPIELGTTMLQIAVYHFKKPTIPKA